MKNTAKRQFFSPAVLATSIAAIGFLAPLVAQAEQSPAGTRDTASLNNQIEVGVGYLSDASYKFGDYGRGLQESGAFLIGNVRLSGRGIDNASYLEVKGRNLGLNGSRDLGIKVGEQGNYGLTFQYGELSKLHSDSFMTPYSGMGTARLTAPAVWTITPAPAGTTIVTTAMMADLAANMKQFNVETRRKALALGLTKQLAGGWGVAVNVKRENKDGTKLTGVPMQIGAGGSRGVLLAPEPVNYTTDLFDAVARYAGEDSHMQVGYHVSLFKNDNQALVFDNLFYNGVSTVGGNALTGQLGQMPDNQFHQVNASGGYNISKAARLTGTLSIGRMTQNDAFLPYSTAAAPASLPAASLNGKIDTTHADIKLSSKLTHDLNLAAGYKYDDRDNRTPVNTYTYTTADVTTAPGTSNTRRNTPLSKKQQAIYADLDYRLSAATRLKLGYDFDKVTHTYEPTAGDREHTVKAEVKHSFSDTTTGGLAYAHSDRRADPYNGAAPLMATYTSTYLASLCAAGNSFSYNGVVTPCTSTTALQTTPFLDTPALRKFFLADRKRDKLHAFAGVAPSEKLDLQFGGSLYKDKYPDTEAGFGLNLARGATLNFDANLAATEEVSGLFFATYENYVTQQNGHNGANITGAGLTSDINRQNNTAAFDVRTGQTNRTDRSLTIGLGFRFKPEDNYELGADFTHADTTGSTGFSNLGSGIIATVRPVPDAVSRLNRLELSGKYKLQKDMSINVRYAYEKYTSTDWAWDGQTYTSSTSFIGSGQTSPDYSVNMINVSLSYLF